MQNNDRFYLSRAMWYGISCATAVLLPTALFGTPHEMIHILGGSKILPPIWIFNLLSTLFCFLVGVAAGAVTEATSRRMNSGKDEISAYKGGLFFLSAFFLSLIRYNIFFFLGRLLISLILSVVCLILTILCCAEWSHIRPKSACGIMALYSLWQFYILFVNISVFIRS